MKIVNITIGDATFPVTVPNSTIDGGGFYISYNDHDTSIYGSDTTALVLGQMEKFYILNGDHRAKYEKLIESGFDACMEYFKANIHLINKRSEKIENSADVESSDVDSSGPGNA